MILPLTSEAGAVQSPLQLMTMSVPPTGTVTTATDNPDDKSKAAVGRCGLTI